MFNIVHETLVIFPDEFHSTNLLNIFELYSQRHVFVMQEQIY